jgi:hypothetical protein
MHNPSSASRMLNHITAADLADLADSADLAGLASRIEVKYRECNELEANEETKRRRMDSLDESTRETEARELVDLKTGHKGLEKDMRLKHKADAAAAALAAAAAEGELNEAHEGQVKETKSQHEVAAAKRTADAAAVAAECVDLVAKKRQEIENLVGSQTNLLKKVEKVRIAFEEVMKAREECAELLEEEKIEPSSETTVQTNGLSGI